jgi:hypothetical protein
MSLPATPEPVGGPLSRAPFPGMRRKWTIALVTTVILSACSSPSIHPLYGPESLVQDPGLVGEWATDGPTVTRVLVSEGSDGRYLGALTVDLKGELKTSLNLEVSLTQIGEDQYVDLYLAKTDRGTLAAHYGFLALPVHQFMMIKREDDVLRVWMFSADWIQRAGPENAFASEILPIGGHEIAVITADSGSLSGFLRKHAHDPGALSPPIVFRRVAHGPNMGGGSVRPGAEG